jgi:hypothetical protein
LQQLRLKDALRRKVAIDFDAAKSLAVGAQDRPAGAFEYSRHRPQELNFISHTTVGATREFAPSTRKLLRLGGLERTQMEANRCARAQPHRMGFVIEA